VTADHPLNESSSQREPAESAEDVRRMYSAKVLAEVEQAEALAPGSDAVPARGNPLARVLVLKGLPGPAEAAGGASVSGADGHAIVKALVALGYLDDDAFFVLTRPEPGISSVQRVARVRGIVEAIDPVVAIALDAEAAEDLSVALDRKITPGTPAEVLGRRFVAVDGFEVSLGSGARKRVVWRQLQAAAPPGPVY
jgi:hypothetical protein